MKRWLVTLIVAMVTLSVFGSVLSIKPVLATGSFVQMAPDTVDSLEEFKVIVLNETTFQPIEGANVTYNGAWNLTNMNGYVELKAPRVVVDTWMNISATWKSQKVTKSILVQETEEEYALLLNETEALLFTIDVYINETFELENYTNYILNCSIEVTEEISYINSTIDLEIGYLNETIVDLEEENTSLTLLEDTLTKLGEVLVFTKLPMEKEEKDELDKEIEELKKSMKDLRERIRELIKWIKDLQKEMKANKKTLGGFVKEIKKKEKEVKEAEKEIKKIRDALKDLKKDLEKMVPCPWWWLFGRIKFLEIKQKVLEERMKLMKQKDKLMQCELKIEWWHKKAMQVIIRKLVKKAIALQKRQKLIQSTLKTKQRDRRMKTQITIYVLKYWPRTPYVGGTAAPVDNVEHALLPPWIAPVLALSIVFVAASITTLYKRKRKARKPQQ